MKKRFLSVALILLIIVNCLSFTALADENVKVYVDYVQVQFDVQPQLIGGRTMVPLRAIFEALGATVSWDEATQTVTAYNEAYLVKATIGQTTMTVNGQAKEMDIAPMMVNDRTLVPARFVAEAFNCNVEWNGEERTVNITTKPIDYNSLETGTEGSVQTESVVVPTTSTVLFNEYSFEPTRELDIKCTNVIRGKQANSIIDSENMFNDKPNNNQEWVIMEFSVNYISSTDGANDELEASDIIYDDTFYTVDKKSLPVYKKATLGDVYGAYGVFKVNMYPGSTSKVVIGLLIDKNMGDILLRVPNKNGNDVAWINCTGETDYSEPVVNNFNDTVNESYTSFYPGTDIPTYTSVTGINLKDQFSLSDGSPVYVYNYTSATDVGDYWRELLSNGWYSLSEDDTSTYDVFESSYYKDGGFVIINVYLDSDEVWITY